MHRTRVLFGILIIMLMAVAPALGARPGFGLLYYEGMVVRTVVPPAATPQRGRDNFYGVTNGVTGQLGIAAVAPGDRDYHGGQWAFYSVTWTAEPSLLTSESAVLMAEAAGHLTVTAVPEMDFKCPIQP